MKATFLLILLIVTASFCYAQMTLSGVYRGENLFIRNPEIADGFFCTDSVYLGGKRLDIATSASAFEIMLDSAGYIAGDSIDLVIYHNDACRPTLLVSAASPPLIMLYSFGLPVYTESELNAIGRKYGVRMVDAGCSEDPGLKKSNEAARIRLVKRNGADWEDRFWDEVERTYGDR